MRSKKTITFLAFTLFCGAICLVNIKSAIAEAFYERDSAEICECDLNQDGSCNILDWPYFIEDWGRSDCPEIAPSPVEKSGQTISYGAGDDGDLKKGVAWPSPRFTDNGDGTVRDNLTGLIWLKQANYNDTSGSTGTASWADALAFCNSLQSGQCGLTDGSVAGEWCLPNIKELQSLIHYAVVDPALPNTSGTGKCSEGDPFCNVHFYYYWSSTTNGINSGFAWYVFLSNGGVYYNAKSNAYYVWCVRGGE